MATDGKRRKQVRLALVVEGGVSLAVWMSGVVHEVDLLRRAGAPGRDPAPDCPDESALGRWRALCNELDVEVVVDVVAGTSAGGLNGALLASAIATGSPLPRLRDLWTDTAELARDKLLNRGEQDPLSSVLDGCYFHEKITGAVREALAQDCPVSHPVSLLTTATALGPQSVQWTDSTGTPFQADDHRRVFLFRHDPDRRSYTPRSPQEPLPADVTDLFPHQHHTDLESKHAESVALAVRATAGFPGAFAPVDEGELAAFRLGPGAPAKLVDGGVLDNTPFEPLLAEVARREVNGPWQRVIGYVVANDGVETPDLDVRLDGFGVLSAALRLPAETSFRDGVEGLAERSLEAERLVSGPEALFSQLLDDEVGIDALGLMPLYQVYRRVRTASGVLDAEAARAAEARPVTVPPLRRDEPSDPASSWVPGPDLTAALGPGDFHWGTAVADRSVRLLLRHLHQCKGDHDAELEQLSKLMTCIAAVRDRIEEHIRCAETVSAEVISEAVVAADGPRVLGALMARAIEIYTGARGTCTAEQVRKALLAVEIVTHASAGHFPFSRPSRFDFVRMGPDIEAPALTWSNGSDRYGEHKLYGRQLHHFGAFGKPEWRAHDFVWGRLDGAAHLVRLLAMCTEVPEWKNSPAIDQKKRDRTIAAQNSVLAEERVVAETLDEETQHVRELDAEGTLNELRRCDDGRTAIRAVVTDVLRTLLPQEAETAPPRSAVVGRWASVVLAEKPAAGIAPRWSKAGIVRLATRRLRRRTWKMILNPSRNQKTARSDR